MSRPWKVVLVTSLAVYLVSLDVTIVNIAFPALLAAFPGSSPAAIAWVLSGYSIAFAASLLVAGRLADRYGRKRMFLTGVAVFAAASGICGLAPNPELLVGARVLQAVGGALLFPASLALLLPEFPIERRSAAIGVWGAVGGVAAATGPSFGSFLVDIISWRAVFFVNLPIAAVAWVIAYRLLRESTDPNAGETPDVLGAIVGAVAVGSLTLGIIQGDDWGYTDARVVIAFGTAAVLIPVFLIRCRAHSNPILDLRLFRLRFFTVANMASFLFSMGFFAMLFVNVNFLVRVWDWSILSAGLAATPGPLTAAAMAVPAGRLADRVGHARVAVPGTVLFVLGMALYVIAIDIEPNYLGVYLPGTLLVGAGVGLTISTLSSASNAFLPPERFGMGSAFHATTRQVAAAVGIATAVVLLGDELDSVGVAAADMSAFDKTWVVLGVVVALSGVLMAMFYRRPTVESELVATPIAST